MLSSFQQDMTNGMTSEDGWKYSQAHNAVLGPFGELLTEEDLLYLQQQIEAVSLQKRCQAYELELTRLTEELRSILPEPLVNISLNKEALRQMDAEGVMPLTLPAWCGRVSEIVKSMSLLVANLTQGAEHEGERRMVEGMMEDFKGLQGLRGSSGIGVQFRSMSGGSEIEPAPCETSGGCRIPHVGMASAFSHRLETNSYSRARIQRVEREIQQCGVSVRNLRSNFEGQIGGIYPFAGVVNGGQLVHGTSKASVQTASVGIDCHVRNHSPAKKLVPVLETTSLRKERIVVLFLSHWKKSAYAISVRAARQRQDQKAAPGKEPSRKTTSMFHFCQQRGAVDKMLNSWKNKLEPRGLPKPSLPSLDPSQNPSPQETYSPEQFLPEVDGVAVSYDSLTLDLFMLGYFHILEQDLSPEERKMRHLLCFEVFDHVGSFPWEVVRDFHRAVLQDIRDGRRQWGDGFEDIKVCFFGDSRLCCGPTQSLPPSADSRLVPKLVVQSATPDDSGSNTDFSCFNNEDICKYIDRSFAFWKEKEAELFDFEQ